MIHRSMRQIFRLIARGAVLALVPAVIIPSAFGAGSGHSADESAIRAQALDYARAFGAASADSLAGLWAESAVFVDQNGNIYHGRSEIKKQYVDFFNRCGGQPLEIMVESIIFPSDDIAIEEGVSRLKNSSSPSALAHYVATHVKRDGKWLMESVSESPFRAASNGEYLKPLAWIVGSWKVEGAESNCQINSEWANKNVISLKVDSGPKNGVRSGHSEFIYWDPQTGCISSFQFDADGGISRKRWERAGESWIVHASSVQSDGSRSRADYIIKQIDNDSFSWQSKQRNLSGAALPDTEPIKVRRVKS